MQGPGVKVNFRVEGPPQHTVLLGERSSCHWSSSLGAHAVCGVTSVWRVPSERAGGLGELLVSCVSIG